MHRARKGEKTKGEIMNILVTGGAGYIGSHTIIELYKAGHTAVVVDNLSNSNPVGLRRVAEIIGVKEIPFYEVDIRDCEGLKRSLLLTSLMLASTLLVSRLWARV